MKHYADEKTGDYLGASNAGEIPGGIEVPMPPTIDHKWRGEWVAIADPERAIREIEAWRSSEESAEVTFEYAGHTWDAGLKSQSRIEPLLKLEALPDGLFWTDHDNNDVPVTMDELRAIAVAMNLAIVERGFAIHQRQREMKQKLESMTAEELLAFEPGWPK